MRIRDMNIINSSTIMQCTAHCIILLMMKSCNYPRLNFAELYISISSREKIVFSYYGIKTVLGKFRENGLPSKETHQDYN